MITDQCNHIWMRLSPATGAQQNSKMVCNKCNTIMTASEVFQLEALENQTETLKHLKGFEKYIAIAALIISFAALLVSIFRR